MVKYPGWYEFISISFSSFFWFLFFYFVSLLICLFVVDMDVVLGESSRVLTVVILFLGHFMYENLLAGLMIQYMTEADEEEKKVYLFPSYLSSLLSFC